MVLLIAGSITVELKFGIINDREWQDILVALRDVESSDQRWTLRLTLQARASVEDVPRLMDLLSDPDFFVREAAAWPPKGNNQ